MPTPTSTSVGASTPKAIRARATSVISPAATHLAVLRQRPSGTRVYSTPVSSAVRVVTCSDGSAQPPQPPQLVWKSTPNGRGRRAIANRPNVTLLPRIQTTSHTIRCRQRRSTSNASTSPYHSANSTPQEPMRAMPRSNGATPGPTRPASQPTTASSITVAVIAGPRRPRPKIARVSPTSTSAATSQPMPLVCSRYGNGGAAPVGRRRRGDRAASRRLGCSGGELVGGDRSAGRSMASPTGAAQPAEGPSRLGCGLSRLRTPRDQPVRSQRSRGPAAQQAPSAHEQRRRVILAIADGAYRLVLVLCDLRRSLALSGRV
jgi:hypothetical protein